MFYKDSEQIYRARRLERLPWLRHGFGTRQSGQWVTGGLATLRQIHSDLCVYADGRTGCLGQGDALVSDRPGQFLGVRTADCLPIFIVDERLRAVAAVHAGWRGTVRGICGKAVGAMQRRFGSRPENLVAAIGPGICGACYVVGPEVARQFKPWFAGRTDLEHRTTIDLAEANRRQLIEAGVPLENVVTGAPCSSCRPGDFFSHRRGPGRAGRMLSAIGIDA